MPAEEANTKDSALLRRRESVCRTPAASWEGWQQELCTGAAPGDKGSANLDMGRELCAPSLVSSAAWVKLSSAVNPWPQVLADHNQTWAAGDMIGPVKRDGEK